MSTRITVEQNDLLCRVSAGTAMGETLRRYWQPACLAEEVTEVDGPPVRVRLLGEDLVVFRDSAGRVGLIDAYCAHRRAPLFFGRNEECGLRCVYHGWKFDVEGSCLDTPTEPSYSRLKTRASLKAYPTREAGGIIWTYMGPGPTVPPFPGYEWLRVPSEFFRISKTGEECNWLQALEGGIDTAHSSFLHNNDLSKGDALRTQDGHPTLEVETTPYGFRYASIRQVAGEQSYVRVYHFIMPNHQMRGGLLGHTGEPADVPCVNGHVWVPIDDEHTWVYNWKYSISRLAPITEEYWVRDETRTGRGPDDYLPGSYWLKRNPSNDFFIDREHQRTRSFTGIDGVNTQDFAVQCGMGPIVDRSAEVLGATDRAVVAARRLLLEAVDEVGGGRAPRGTDPTTYSCVRAADALIPRATPWREAMEEKLLARWEYERALS